MHCDDAAAAMLDCTVRCNLVVGVFVAIHTVDCTAQYACKRVSELVCTVEFSVVGQAVVAIHSRLQHNLAKESHSSRNLLCQSTTVLRIWP